MCVSKAHSIQARFNTAEDLCVKTGVCVRVADGRTDGRKKRGYLLQCKIFVTSFD